MKKIMSLFIVGVFVLSGLGAVALDNGSDLNKIAEKIVFSKPVIEQENDYATIHFEESTSNAMNPGKPVLPKYTGVYTLPFGSHVKNVEVVFSETFEKEINKPIIPAPEPQIVSTIYKPESVKTYDIIETYSDIDIYPESKYDYRVGAGLKDSEHVIYVTVNIYPVQYNPSSNMIYYSENAQIDISYDLPIEPIAFLDVYDFLIITPSEFSQEFNNPISEFDISYIDYKNGKGISTKLVTLEEIYNGDYFPVIGIDNQEKIKYFIKDAIENWGVTHVLLVGSGLPGNEKFPVRYAYVPSGRYEEKFPSDLYYADIYDANMSFSDWDKDGDGEYAEYSETGNDMDNVDLFPDVYLGKIPCKDVAEVQNILRKILYFEKHNKVTNKIVQIGGDTFPGDNQKVNEGEFANSEVLKKLPGYITTQLWASNGRLTKRDIANGFNSLVDFVDFSGHGSWGSWATHDTQDDEVWLPAKTTISPYTGWLYVDYDLYTVQNVEKLSVVVFNACSCHKYTDHASCIGWKTLNSNSGGIASFGASGIGYGSYGTYETERVFGWMEVHIFEELVTTKNLGEVWSNVLSGYVNTHWENDWHGTDYKTVLETSMFGDPTVNIEDGENPKIKNVSRPILHNIIERLLDIFPRLERLLAFLEIF